MRALDAMPSLDQASGLRRLLQSAPPRLLAVQGFSEVTTPWLAAQLRLRAVAGVRTLVLDEAGGLTTMLAGEELADLLDAVDAGGEPGDWRAFPLAGLQLVRVGRLVKRFSQDRICRQRSLRLLEVMRLGCDEWILNLGVADASGPSAFGRAAQRLLLLIDEDAAVAQQAWAMLQHLRAAGSQQQLAVCYAGRARNDGWRLAQGFAALAHSRLGMALRPVASLGEAQLPDAREGGACVDAYLASLVQT